MKTNIHICRIAQGVLFTLAVTLNSAVNASVTHSTATREAEVKAAAMRLDAFTTSLEQTIRFEAPKATDQDAEAAELEFATARLEMWALVTETEMQYVSPQVMDGEVEYEADLALQNLEAYAIAQEMTLAYMAPAAE